MEFDDHHGHERTGKTLLDNKNGRQGGQDGRQDGTMDKAKDQDADADAQAQDKDGSPDGYGSLVVRSGRTCVGVQCRPAVHLLFFASTSPINQVQGLF